MKPHARKRYFGKTIGTPVGALRLVASDAGLAAVLWENDDPGRVPLGDIEESRNHPILLDAERQLKEYFSGERKTFTLKLDFAGTQFQRRVWSALLTIPYGETRSYRDIAGQIGSPAAVRAVGAANGKNPISIITPCHRVIGANGKLTGFAGGLEVKARLLALEAPQPELPELQMAGTRGAAQRPKAKAGARAAREHWQHESRRATS